MRAALLPVAALCLNGCAADSTQTTMADSPIVRLQRAHEAARAVSLLFRPYLSPAQTARIDALGLLVDRALAAAQVAHDRASRRAALTDAAAAANAYRLATGG
ncbi:hypothetical protein ASG67_02280 [Sphingomonas sp. Leaf339]|uniref:hypothetical protein n=1 Tax=Sphingomonas sp. Leaf339 TaxID=1736343 RepID=UPI0006FF2293|nr:hypothetical protein [Sphingomonas sp. Leaf339]KQU61993.1 hypothetical protein ASG67_02280 [Sphingomonas sp. Leaf339]